MGPVRLELTTFALKGRYSHQLNYGPNNKDFYLIFQVLDERSSASLTDSPNIPHLATVWGTTVPVQKVAHLIKKREGR